METRTLSRTGLTVSRVCCGTMTFGAQTDEAIATAMVDTCIDRGINFFDTANVYTNGEAERILGRALRGRRNRVVLASKIAGRMGPEPDQSGLSQTAIARCVDESLGRLQTDYLDICYLHWPDYAVPVEETLEAMGRLVKEGKVLHVGASNYASWQICRMLWLAERNGFPTVGITQPMYNLLSRGIEQEFLPMCRAFDVATVVYNPLAGGLLTGKQKSATPLPGTRFDLMKTYVDRYWHDANFAAIQELTEIAARNSRSLVSLALNWVLHHSAADCLILGASKLEHLKENLAVLGEGPLPETAVEACDRVWDRLRGPSPKYNR